ncbi:hypothetical protein N0V82_003561 [Gnomoniopsis sp. IMI 355080]|nr:hypothetical protein N0V82_003561 [Gnomoniopsis sp. IMI 355080]
MKQIVITRHGSEAWDNLSAKETDGDFDYEKDSADMAKRIEAARCKGALTSPDPDTYGSAADPFDSDFSNRPSTDLLSQPHVELVRRWSEECAITHTACQSVKLEQQLPTRVLKILSSSSGEVESISLFEARGEKGTYAALSYCWGMTPQLEKTTTENLARHLEVILLKDLPNTIADAIRLCHRLGFHYLWVDALCIIQDDLADWTREAASMCDVYGNAALTLVTSLVGDSSESFIEARRNGSLSSEVMAEILFTNPKSGLPGGLWVFWDFFPDGPWVLENDWNNISGRERNPYEWLGRAWCFQEWVLSPRILHIHEQTLWDCFEGYASELSCRHVGPTNLRRDLRRAGDQVTLWSNIVAEFTSRAITKASDRLPALAGLAVAYSNATGRQTYLAGLWFENLPLELLWDAGSPFDDDPHPRTPSFSWVSLNAPVTFHDNKLTYRAKFDIKCSVISWSCQDDGDTIWTRRNVTIELEGRLSRFNGAAPPHGIPYDKWTANFDREDEVVGSGVVEGEMYLFLVVGGHHFFRHYEWRALVLRKVGSEDGMDSFRRIGVATIRLQHYDKENPPETPPATAECDEPWERRSVRLR